MTKVWQDAGDFERIRPESITINLQRRINGGDWETVQTVQMTGEGDVWYYSFNRLANVNGNGRLYQYRVREESVEGYSVEYNGYTITNVHAVVTPTPEPTPEPTPTAEPTPDPTATPLPTPVMPDVTPDRAVGMQYVDGEWLWIDDLGVPLGVVAQTGDNDNLAAVLGGMALLMVLAGVLALTIYRKQKR